MSAWTCGCDPEANNHHCSSYPRCTYGRVTGVWMPFGIVEQAFQQALVDALPVEPAPTVESHQREAHARLANENTELRAMVRELNERIANLTEKLQEYRLRCTR